MAPFTPEAGIETSEWPTSCALRMRVSMSAIGSCMLITSPLPARLDDSRDFALEGKVAELVAGEPELAIHAARTPGQRAAVADTDRRRVARQLLQLGARFLFRLVGGTRVVDDLEQGRAFRLELLDGLAALFVAEL